MRDAHFAIDFENLLPSEHIECLGARIIRSERLLPVWRAADGAPIRRFSAA